MRGLAGVAAQSEGCWKAMPAEREDEICRKALELLSDLCSKGEVQNDNCLDFIYHFRDLARPRYTDSGESIGRLQMCLNLLAIHFLL